jgi:hypothetical protein
MLKCEVKARTLLPKAEPPAAPIVGAAGGFAWPV